MHDDRKLVEERIEDLRERLIGKEYATLTKLNVEAWKAPDEPVPFAEAASQQYEPFPVGTWWGPAWSTWWLRLDGILPDDAPRERVELRVDLGFSGDWAGNQSEGLVYTCNGVPLKGLNPMNRTVPLTFGSIAQQLEHEGSPLVAADGSVRLMVEAAANPNHGEDMAKYGDKATMPIEPMWQFKAAELVVRNDDVWHLQLDIEVLDGLMRELPVDSTWRATLLRGLERAADVVDQGSIEEQAAAARAVLAPLLNSGPHGSAQRMTAVGHAHIDSAWLWPIRETRRKVVRSLSNVVALADEYPDFHFACTAPQHLQWLKEDAPMVFERMREAIQRGQWHMVGGTWIEPDANLPGGEAMVRQLTSGLRWLREELDVTTDCLWLPDSFGYSGALPQIAKLAGMRWFFTQKMNWNQTNTLPHHTFWWEGIDGTRIWTHFPPVDCYDSILSPDQVKFAERNFKEKGVAKESLLPFGYGDGGGGPVREMVERARRQSNLEGSPVLTMGSPQDFYDAARAERDELPVWAGELYFEFHRGVQTSQLALKQGNRRVEAGLAALEWLGTLAMLRGHAYDAEGVEQLWRRMMLLQFHDILPGSAIAWVNEEAREEYASLLQDIEERIDALRRDVFPGEQRAIANPSPFARRELVEVEGRRMLVDVGPLSVVALADAEATPTHPVQAQRQDEGIVLDNGLVRVVVAPDGTVTSLVDVEAERELLLPDERANLLRLHPDHPSCFDAWELQAQYRHHVWELDDAEQVALVEDTPLRAQVDVVRVFGDSRVTQSLWLDADSKTVRFAVDIDWHERSRVLKVAFPLAVKATHESSEIQFGHVRRALTSNTSWDEARFEVPGHRWTLLDEPGYAVALSYDSSYGHDVEPAGAAEDAPTAGVVASYTLLRAPLSPDKESDQGQHRIQYQLTVDADVRAASEAGVGLNQPLRVMEGAGASEAAVASLEMLRGHAVIDAVKPAFDESGDVVIRLHEATGGRSRVRLHLGFDAQGVHEVDLLEQPVDEPTQQRLGDLRDGAVELTLRPFQILTLKVCAK